MLPQIVHQRLLEQMDRVRRMRSALGLLRIESRMLRRKLDADWDERVRAGFAASWRSIEERLEAERREAELKTISDELGWLGERLRGLREQVAQCRSILEARGQRRPGAADLDVLDRDSEAFDRSLETLGRQLAAEIDERLRLAYERPS
ncbi:MAG TPA: hypothetical protein VMM92_07450 [Thermoanaerobaculia bacterium]|nr:hypothetical protein [Thermoanaerobaculia bacterium]